MKVLCIDGHNFLHRARAGFQGGPYNIVFNFFRNLRALVEQQEPSRVIFVLEGHPKARYELLPEYKANRKLEGDPEDPKFIQKKQELESFFRQKDLIVDLLLKHFPVSVVRHPDHECDDVIYNLIKKSSTAIPWTVVSNDSDFTQLLNEFDHVSIYNPMAKVYVQHPGFDYVTWKSLRGDGSDNIPGIPGVGDKKAEQLVNDPQLLREFFESNPGSAETFMRNMDLIRFKTWTEEESLEMFSSSPIKDWASVAAKFDEWAFRSILKEKSWEKFVKSFDHLWG